MNRDQKQLKAQMGFMNDGTYMNASDPSSMKDMGNIRNAVYNVKFDNVPEVQKTTYSKAIGHHNPGSINNTFYSFGANHTNIRKNLK